SRSATSPRASAPRSRWSATTCGCCAARAWCAASATSAGCCTPPPTPTSATCWPTCSNTPTNRTDPPGRTARTRDRWPMHPTTRAATLAANPIKDGPMTRLALHAAAVGALALGFASAPATAGSGDIDALIDRQYADVLQEMPQVASLLRLDGGE